MRDSLPWFGVLAVVGGLWKVNDVYGFPGLMAALGGLIMVSLLTLLWLHWWNSWPELPTDSTVYRRRNRTAWQNTLHDMSMDAEPKR